jgi:hypothetical protein
MSVDKLIDLYTDFLVYTPDVASCTALSEVLQGEVSHDKFTRMLSKGVLNSKKVWQETKAICEEIRTDEAVLIIDDSVEEKKYSRCNDLIQWHFDHTEGRSVKGVNFVTAIYNSWEMSIPVGVDFVRKEEKYIDKKTGKEKLRSSISKNEMFRELVLRASRNTSFKYVLSDSWFCNSDNMNFIIEKCNSNFIMAIKQNRKVALSAQDKKKGKYVSIKELELEKCVLSVYVKSLEFPILITKQVFKNGDGATAALYLVSNDLSLSYEQMTTIYKKRWKVEEYHKSIKSNTAFSKSPTKKQHTQQAHFVASILAYVKLEKLKIKNNRNHFALKAIIRASATKAAFRSYQQLNYKKVA